MPALRTFGPNEQASALRVTEGTLPLETYANGDGYKAEFVDAANPMPLPGAGRWRDDLVAMKPGMSAVGADPTELPYTHFSVKLSKSRSLPLFSAVNIDGRRMQRDIDRTDVWRRDPRIDGLFQNLREGYGNAQQGLFSRGHMTRREDPNWGDVNTATRADLDTFHITNVAPQRQGFNAGIWLGLEDYVLDNTDDADMKVSVLTGPILADDDPVYYNIRVPVAFWKVIVFTHVRTRLLTTIGYRRSQFDFLPGVRRSRFVFGDFDDTQVSIASLELDTGLDFSAYVPFDVLTGAGAGLEVRLSGASDAYLVR